MPTVQEAIDQYNAALSQLDTHLSAGTVPTDPHPSLHKKEGAVLNALVAAINSVQPGANALPAPASFSAAAINSTSVSLSWSQVPSAIGYSLETSLTEAGTYSSLTLLIGTSYTHTGLAPLSGHYYRLKAIGVGYGTESPYSAIRAATTTAPPSGTDTRTALDGPTGAPNVTWENPITLLTGMAVNGVITIKDRNFRSLDGGVAAIQTNCGGTPVEIINCNILSLGEGISCGGGANVKLRDVAIYGANPTMDGQPRQRGFYAYRPINIDIQYLTMESNGGLKIDGWQGDNSASSQLQVHNVRMRNVIGVNGDFRHTIQFANVHTKNFDCSYIETYNQPDLSRTEDTFNMYNCGGWDAANPMRVKGLGLFGAYPYGALNTQFTGAAISADGSGDPNERHSEYIYVDDAFLTSHCNAGANIATGHDIHYNNIYAVTSGYLQDGRQLTSTYKGFWIGDYYGLGAGANNTITGIKTRFMRTKDVFRRSDFNADPNVPSENPNPGVDVANAILLPDPPNVAAALQQENDCFRAWIQYLNTHNQTCGKRP